MHSIILCIILSCYWKNTTNGTSDQNLCEPMSLLLPPKRDLSHHFLGKHYHTKLFSWYFILCWEHYPSRKVMLHQRLFWGVKYKQSGKYADNTNNLFRNLYHNSKCHCHWKIMLLLNKGFPVKIGRPLVDAYYNLCYLYSHWTYILLYVCFS